MNKFNRSSYMKSLHKSAKLQRDFYKSQFPNNDFKYSDFLKNESPLKKEIITYSVSYQVSYTGVNDDITLTPQTFSVMGLKNQSHDIEQKTMDMILDSKGRVTGDGFIGNTTGAIEKNTKIDIKPRGLEVSQTKPSNQDIDKIILGGYVVKNLDENIKMKNRKKREGDLKFDVRHFG